MSELMDRMNRWSEALPKAEDIPLNESDTWELAEWIAASRLKSSPKEREEWLSLIMADKCLFRGHHVVVLR